MGASQSKPAIEKVIKETAKSAGQNLKESAKRPNKEKGVFNVVDQEMKKQFTYLRQVEKEFEKQKNKPKPAPIQTQTSWGSDPWAKISDEEKEERRRKFREIYENKDLAARLTNIGTLDDDNMKVDNIQTSLEKDQKNPYYEDLYNQSMEYKRQDGLKIEGVDGRRHPAAIINIISNHKNNPTGWTPEKIAEYTKMNEDDIENICNYYDLLDEDQVYFEFPKEGLHFNEKYKKWFVGPGINKNDTPEQAKEKLKFLKEHGKPVASEADIKQFRDYRDRYGKIDMKKMKEFKEKYYVDEQIYKEITTERDPNDRMLQSHVKSPARYNTDNLIDKLEKQYRIELGQRQQDLLKKIDDRITAGGSSDNLGSSSLLEDQNSDQIDLKQLGVPLDQGGEANLKKIQELESDIAKFERTKKKAAKIDRANLKTFKQNKHQGRFGDDAS